jgi:hypothetical protein
MPIDKADISARRSLHRLIYASSECLDADEDLGAIIRSSIRNNRAVSITGLLLLHDGWFLQALEGPAEAVMTTYGRIARDRRHFDCTILSAGPVQAREFGDWNMCARRLSPADDAILDALHQRETFAPAKLSGQSALRLLKAVRGIQNRIQIAAA